MKKIYCFLMMFVFMVVPHGANAMVGIECENNKVLVAYFSATGNTAQVADKIYESLNEMMTVDADLVEIKPEQPYTDKDLNWNDKSSRSSIEMSGNSERPAVATKIKDIDKYNVIFLGFPIWWGREPAIIDAFLESYDFAKKPEIIPFATSGSSGMGNTRENIQSLAPNAKVYEGQRFTTDVSKDDITDWVFPYAVVTCPL